MMNPQKRASRDENEEPLCGTVLRQGWLALIRNSENELKKQQERRCYDKKRGNVA